MSDETYEGWRNRETWAFNLHRSNDQGLYNETLERAKEFLSENNEGLSDYALGRHVIEYWKEFIEDYEDAFGEPVPEGLKMFYREVGSWWRVNAVEIGAPVRESLD